MFTGIIQEVGTVLNLKRSGESARLAIRSRLLAPSLNPGDSLAVSGVCLTLVEAGPARLEMDVSGETLSRTNLGELKPGEKVNLEPPLSWGKEVGGHLVTGHIDGMGKLVSRQASGRDWIYRIALPPDMLPHLVGKGSLAVEGVSLTVAAISGEEVSISIIPYTFKHTTLGLKTRGCSLNIETDLLGKYVAKYLEGKKDRKSARPSPSLNWESLKESGFI